MIFTEDQDDNYLCLSGEMSPDELTDRILGKWPMVKLNEVTVEGVIHEWYKTGMIRITVKDDYFKRMKK